MLNFSQSTVATIIKDTDGIPDIVKGSASMKSMSNYDFTTALAWMSDLSAYGTFDLRAGADSSF